MMATASRNWQQSARAGGGCCPRATVAGGHGATPAQVALAWVMAQPGLTAPIASATSVAQLQELMGAAELSLSAEDLKALDVASAPE